MERGKCSVLPVSQTEERAPLRDFHVNHEKRKPLFANKNITAPRALGIRDAGLEARSATASVGTAVKSFDPKTGSLGSTRRARSDPQGAASELGHVRGGAFVTANAAICSPGTNRASDAATCGLQSRRPWSMTEAFKLAQEEEEEAERQRQLGGSPSPAPRPWRARPGQPQDELQERQMLAEDPLDSKTRTGPSSAAPIRQPEQASLARAELQEAGTESGQSKGFGPGPSLQERINEWRTKSRPTSLPGRFNPNVGGPIADSIGEARIPALVPGIEDVPVQYAGSPRRNFDLSPLKKDFFWDVDQDFTAGDLQISDSPRIRVGNNSNRPFENRPSIFSDIKYVPSPVKKSSPRRATNPKTEDIKSDELEHGAANATSSNTHPTNGLKLPEKRQNSIVDQIRAKEVEVDEKMPLPDRSKPRQKNEKLENIRQRESAGLSKRALAAIRLAEIKEQNAMARLCLSNTTQLNNKSEATREAGVAADSISAVRGEHIPDSPVTIFRSYGNQQENVKPPDRGIRKTIGAAEHNNVVNERELLQRLARATSSSPAPDPSNKQTSLAEPTKKGLGPKPTTRPTLAGRFTDISRRSALTSSSMSNLNSSGGNNPNSKNKDSQPARPTVGFAGLRRANSAESVKSKRPSMHSNPDSDSDPTDRIEAEMELFALADYYSERGSAHASSVSSESDEEQEALNDVTDATPQPSQHDLFSIPTPQVTGAYVETPVTEKPIKVTYEQDQASIKSFSEKLKGQRERSQEAQDKKVKQRRHNSENLNLTRDKKASLARRWKDEDTASEPGAEAGGQGKAITTSPNPKEKPRSRSLPRKRPPLKNSAKPPSVKDDLRELQRQHNINDSTLDDFEDTMAELKHASPKLEGSRKQLPSKTKDSVDHCARAVEDEIKQESTSDAPEGQSTLVEKMSKTVWSGLSNIREVRTGIERLEDQSACDGEKISSKRPENARLKQEDAKPLKPFAHARRHREKYEHPQEECPACVADSKPLAVTYLHFPVPRLYVATPQLRLTTLGVFLTVFIIWLAAESVTCGLVCRPTTCDSTPCVYSYDDPTFGVALPVKFDQWVGRGYGRIVAIRAHDAVQDYIADLMDKIQGRSIQDVAVERLNAEERRQHWRRLSKKGLLKNTVQPLAPDQKAKWESWRRSRLAKKRAREAKDMGYDMGRGWMDEDTIDGDERI